MQHSPIFEVFIHKNLADICVLHVLDQLRTQRL
jgi:hypothetical protein